MSGSTVRGSSTKTGNAPEEKRLAVHGEELEQIKDSIDKAYKYLDEISAKLTGQEKPLRESKFYGKTTQSDMEAIKDDCINNKCDYLKFVENGRFNY